MCQFSLPKYSILGYVPHLHNASILVMFLYVKVLKHLGRQWVKMKLRLITLNSIFNVVIGESGFTALDIDLSSIFSRSMCFEYLCI